MRNNQKFGIIASSRHFSKPLGSSDFNHAGVVHRDLKPGNVILAEDGNAKVLDFGLANRLQTPADPAILAADSNPTDFAAGDFSGVAQGAIFGAVAYMSPEQARGEILDERTDIFAFGVILFELVSG